MSALQGGDKTVNYGFDFAKVVQRYFEQFGGAGVTALIV
jgi:hypothetical protein